MARIEGVDPAAVGGVPGVSDEKILALRGDTTGPLHGGAERPAREASRPGPDGAGS